MSYVIDLSEHVEARTEHEAKKAGISPTELAADVMRKKFGIKVDSERQKLLNGPSIALLNSWLAEADKPRTSKELAEAEGDMEELMRNLNSTRRKAGERLHFPDVTSKP